MMRINDKKKFTIIIPARFNSKRLPGKPLMNISGEPMIKHVWKQACKSSSKRVIISTDDIRIFNVCLNFGAEVILTSSKHNSGTDRVAESVFKLGLNDDEIIVNIQGDEPLISPIIIDKVAFSLMHNSLATIATIAEPIEKIEHIFDKNIVKVISDINGYALFFFRYPFFLSKEQFKIYFYKKKLGNSLYRKHIGIYAYDVKFLETFIKLLPCQLEMIENLEQLRALWNGYKIYISYSNNNYSTPSVNTHKELEEVRTIFNQI